MVPLHRSSGQTTPLHGLLTAISLADLPAPGPAYRPPDSWSPTSMATPQPILDQIIGLAAAGLSRTVIADKVGLSRSSVCGMPSAKQDT
jgi:hypothetical protein